MLDTTVPPASFTAERVRTVVSASAADAAASAETSPGAEPDVFHPGADAGNDPAQAAAGRPLPTAAGRPIDDAAAADLACLAIRAALDRLSGALARAAAAFVALRAWTVFGFARLDDHARERCGRSGRWFRDLAALGEGIAAVPRLADALAGADGGRPLGRVAATLVARALAARAGGGDQDAGLDTRCAAADLWIEAARCLSVRDLRAVIRLARADADAKSDADADAVPDAAADAEADADAAPDAKAGAAVGLSAASDAEPADPPSTDLDAASDPDADRVLLRLPVPSPMIAAFDEALDLHRAVDGHASSVTAFVESLVGEAQSGGAAPSTGFVRALEHGTPEARLEAALRRASAAWSALPGPLPVAAASGRDGMPPHLLSRFGALEAVAGEGDPVEVDRQIRSLIDIETELEAGLGRLLALMTERGDWARLRFSGVGHYAEERLGMSRSRAGERARLARALRALPAIADACSSGRISMEAAAIIHRILSAADDSASPGDRPPSASLHGLETAWVEHASTVTIKRMRDEARALGRYRARACASNAVPSAGPVPRTRPLRDYQWCASLRREAGTATGRILMFGLRAAGFAPAPPEPDVFHALMPEPDATLRLRLPADLAADFLAAIEAARAAVEGRVASIPWDAPWPGGEPAAGSCPATVGSGPSAAGSGPLAAGPCPSAAELAARVAFIRGRRVPTWVGLLALLEDFAATWDTDAAAPERRDDRVFIRDGWRCAAPGCSSRRNLEDHHIVYRSRGGGGELSNRVTLCRFHHQRGEHGGLMSVRGVAPAALCWRLGRPDVAVTFRNERRVPR